MAKNANFVSHKKSKLKDNGGPKLPLASDLVEGEIAINFGKDVETISIKNESGDVVTFSSDNYYTDKKLGSGFTGENSAVTVTDTILWESGTGLNSVVQKGPSGTASGDHSVAEGQNTTASGDYSHAEGYSTTASGQSSHAEGANTKASGSYSHAEGNYTVASGFCSHAEGVSTSASGGYSHAEGANTKANGDGSHTEGCGTKANNESEHASGQYNVSSSASTTFGDGGNTLFSVGNGTASDARHNAFEIRQNGDIYIVNKDGDDVRLQDEIGNIDVDQVLDDTTSASTNPVSSKAVYKAVTDNELVWTNAFVALSGTVSAHTENTEIHVTSADKADWDAKLDASDLDDYYEKSETSGATELEAAFDDINNKLGSGFTVSSVTEVIESNERVIASSLTDLDERKLDASAYTPTDLSNYYKKSETSGNTELSTAFSNKVDKVSGKGLSTNDYTTNEKDKLSGIASGAQVNVIETVKVNGTALTPSSKAVNVTVPTKTSDLTNDSNFVSDASYVHTDNNYTTTEKNKLAGIAASAEVNQNAFSNIKVGSTTIAADSKTDTLEISGSGIVTITADATNDKITISASNAVTSVAGKTGAVTLVKGDVGLGNVDNTADTNKTVKAATSAATADTAKAVALSGVSNADDLKAIEALTGTSGLLKKTAANTWTLDTNSYSTTAVAVTGATYNSANKTIDLKNAVGTVVSTVDATAFIKDGMVSNVEVKNVASSGTCLVITFNTDAGKDAINIPISQIFDANNYYTKADLTGSSTTVVVAKASSAATAASAGSVALSNVTGADDLKAIEALTGTSGLLKKTAANTWALDTTSYSSATQVNTALGTKSDTGHTHDGTYAKSTFSRVTVGSTNIDADTTGDTITLVGSNVTLTPDATNDKLTIGITKSNVTTALGYTPPTTDTNYYATGLTVATATTANTLTISGTNSAVKGSGVISAATTTAAGLMSADDKTKLNGIAAGAEANVQSDWNATSGDALILNKPTIPAAAANGTYTVKTLVGSTTTNVSDFTANQSSADDITFVQGSNVTITPDATNRRITIASTDTDTKVTSVGNHYAPTATSADTKSATASSTSELNWGSAVVTGVTLSGDAKGHITSVTVASSKLKTPVTGVTIASGTNNGTVKLTVNGSATDNIAVKGLGSMAYQATTSYSSATQVNTALASKAGTGITITAASGLTGGGNLSANRTIGLAATGTSGTYGPTADVTGTEGTTIKIPQITTDAYGRVTSVTERTLTNKNSTYTVNNGTFAISGNGTSVASTSANASANSGLNIKSGSNVTITTGTNEITIAATDTKYTEGRAIDVTNNVISLGLPISAGTGTNSIIEGAGTTASGQSSHAEGADTTASGGYSHAEGYYTKANGLSSHAEGDSTTASGVGSHAEGQGTTASGQSSHAEGNRTTASGQSSHAEGSGTTASGGYSHAEGANTQAIGPQSHAEGYYTKANGESSHAEGQGTTASGRYSHAEGYITSAMTYYSHAEGYYTTASGSYSHAEGNRTTANGESSHAEGYYTAANNKSEHASGQYNVSSSASTTFGDSGNTLFSVGNGTANNARHNAFEVRQNGDIYISSGGTNTSPMIKLQDVVDDLNGQSETVATALVDLNTTITAHTASTVHMNDTEKTNLDSLATNIETISGITSTDKLIHDTMNRRTRTNFTSKGLEWFKATLKSAIADKSLEKYGLKVGDYCTATHDGKTYNYVIAGLNTMKGTHSYRLTTDHVGIIVDTNDTHAWNTSNSTATSQNTHLADGTWTSGTSAAGYASCDLQYYLETTVLPNVESDLGSDNIKSHYKLYSNAVNTSGYNRFGSPGGCSSSWAWYANQKICALSEIQVYGSIVWSSSGYDTGEACRQLDVFRVYNMNEIFEDHYPWLRDVASSSFACFVHYRGRADRDYANTTGYVAALILFA